MSALSKKPTKAISTIAVIAFVAIAGLTTYSVYHLVNRVDGAKISQINGVPEIWTDLRRPSNIVSTASSTAQADYISYLVTVENLDPEDTYKITHVSSFVDGNDKGFLPFNASSLEYSYTNQPNSWSPVSISSPGYDANGFELKSPLSIGSADSGRSKLYFRYNVTPSAAGVVSDKIAFVVEDEFYSRSMAVSDNTIAYEPTGSTEVVATNQKTDYTPADGDSSESAFAQPLGATNTGPDTSIIPLATVGAISLPIDNNFLTVLAIISICIGIFVVAAVVYIVMRRRTAKRIS